MSHKLPPRPSFLPPAPPHSSSLLEEEQQDQVVARKSNGQNGEEKDEWLKWIENDLKKAKTAANSQSQSQNNGIIKDQEEENEEEEEEEEESEWEYVTETESEYEDSSEEKEQNQDKKVSEYEDSSVDNDQNQNENEESEYEEEEVEEEEVVECQTDNQILKAENENIDSEEDEIEYEEDEIEYEEDVIENVVEDNKDNCKESNRDKKQSDEEDNKTNNCDRPDRKLSDEALDDMLTRIKKLREERKQILNDMSVMKAAFGDQNEAEIKEEVEEVEVKTTKLCRNISEEVSSDQICCFICGTVLGKKLNLGAMMHMGLEDGEPICPKALYLTQTSLDKIKGMAETKNLVHLNVLTFNYKILLIIIY